MAYSPMRLSEALTSRRGAWVSISIVLIAVVTMFGIFSGAQAPPRTGSAPVGSESQLVDELLDTFPGSDIQPVLVVAERTDATPLTPADLAALGAMVPSLATPSDQPPLGPIPSADGQIALISVPISVGADGTETAVFVEELRADLATLAPAGLTLLVTGGPAFGADLASSFSGADMTLLIVTIMIVALLLILTYRSPYLWLIPLVVVAVADGLAGALTTAAGEAWGLEFDAGIISVLVFGAGTNYALLLISRYREELTVQADHRKAMSVAWRSTLPAIVASNFTVVLALLTLLLATIPMTRGLGVPAAIGLLVALVVVIFALPPLLAIFGPHVFWPFVPRVDEVRANGRNWRKMATRVVKRPTISILAAFALLGVMASGLIGTSVGLSQTEKFRVESESLAGLELLSEHFPAGEAQPIYVVAASAATPAVLQAAGELEGVIRAVPAGQSEDGSLTKIMITSQHEPSSPESLDQVRELRELLHAIPAADALVGGAVATEFDARAGNERDLFLLAPLILLVSFVVLIFLLRSLIAPVLLLIVNFSSAVAAIGAGAWMTRNVLEQPALDLQVPLLSFLFLVALGIDYTIFLVHRARSEVGRLGTRDAMVEAIAHTGSVITSAGIVLAAVFAALGVLPLVTLGQVGLIVGIGVFVDTFVVRTVIVPAIFALVGARIWWPAIPRGERTEWDHEPR